MGALRKAGVWLGLIEDDDERYGYDERAYDDDFPDDDVEDTSAMVRARVADRLAESRHERDYAQERRQAERALDRGHDRPQTTVRPIARQTSPAYPTRDSLALAPEPEPEPEPEPVARVAPAPVVPQHREVDERRYQITTLHPTTFNDARAVGEHFRDGVPVIMNLTEMAESDAKRLVDFAAGLAFGLRGTMERVTNRVFLLSPANVQVTAEDKAKIAEGGYLFQR